MESIKEAARGSQPSRKTLSRSMSRRLRIPATACEARCASPPTGGKRPERRELPVLQHSTDKSRTESQSWLRWTLTTVIVCLSALCEPSSGIDVANLGNIKVRGLTVPIYLPGDSQSVGVIRVEKVFKDSQRRGFFRIGLFPVAVLENVRCQVNRPQDAAAILSEVSGVTRLVRDTKGVEIRGIELRLAEADQPAVEARTAKPSPGGAWSLTGGVKLRVGSQVAQIQSASLCVTRTNEVTIIWNSRGQTNQMTLFKNP